MLNRANHETMWQAWMRLDTKIGRLRIYGVDGPEHVFHLAQRKSWKFLLHISSQHLVPPNGAFGSHGGFSCGRVQPRCGHLQ